MKPLQTPAEKGKAVGLVVLVVVVFGFIVKTITGAGNGGAAPGPGPVVQITGTGSASGAGAAPQQDTVAVNSSGQTTVVIAPPPGLAPKPEDDMVDAPTFGPGQTPNPFHKAVVGYSGLMPAQPIQTPISIGSPPPVRVPRGRRPVRSRGDGGGLSGSFPGLPVPGTGTMEVRPDAEALQVMGVNGGPNPVAVISVGGQQFVVSKGDTFGRGYQLKEISDKQVVIEQNGALHILRVGAHGAAPSAPPPNTNPSNSNPPSVSVNGVGDSIS